MSKHNGKLVKESLLVAVLASSLGVFVSKLLGLIYYVPLNDLAGTANMSLYSIAYTYYDILLNVSSAGIPFALATLVAKYVAKEDYKTTLLVKKLGISFVFILSVFVVIVFIILAGPLARQSLGDHATTADIENLKIVFYILIVAVLIVPFLSTIRGYYQGLKRLDLYGTSQVLEQFVRVVFIIVGGYLAVRVFNLESVWAIFIAIAAASVAAIASVIFIKLNTKHEDKRIEELIASQTSDAIAKKELIKEIVFIVLPYLIITIFGSSSSFVNSTFFIKYSTSLGRDYETQKLVFGILNANCAKLMSIPSIISVGFSSGLVPFLTESLTKLDFDKLQKQVNQIIESVFYFLIPLLLIYVFFSKDIYYVMYGNVNLELGAELLMIATISGFTDTLAPIISNAMITLRLKKQTLIVVFISAFIKLGSFFIFVKLFDAYGMPLSAAACSLFVLASYSFILKKKYGVSITKSLIKGLKILISSIVVIGLMGLLRSLLPIQYTSRIIIFIVLAIFGLVMAFLYFFVTSKLNLPQEILNIKDASFKDFVKRLLKR